MFYCRLTWLHSDVSEDQALFSVIIIQGTKHLMAQSYSQDHVSIAQLRSCIPPAGNLRGGKRHSNTANSQGNTADTHQSKLHVNNTPMLAMDRGSQSTKETMPPQFPTTNKRTEPDRQKDNAHLPVSESLCFTGGGLKPLISKRLQAAGLFDQRPAR